MAVANEQVPGQAGEDGPPAEPKPPSSYRVITPTDWFRVPLLSTAKRDRSVQTLVDMTYPNRDQDAARRHDLKELLSTVVADAAQRDGVELYISTQGVFGVPIPATLLVTAEPEDPEHPVSLPPEMLADGIRDKYGESAQVSVVALGSGPAVRSRRQELTPEARELGQPEERPNTLLEFYLPVPNTGAWLLLTFSTPIPELADAQVEMFDAIAGSLRWA
ncbi:hypothetical protein [Streptomyces sp. NBC_01803]|uniref:hypothetical protein n=1 Tax=Streptomyces sp. NBC_01803 TaxID=2975946 RepID=UPI002DD8A12D|nr:hypothetical protein [Streptomyces sp. NBC_01803]WSA45613.1 hypothetical protein OIE51_16235 [Streptomyces sp. NBC_01803]